MTMTTEEVLKQQAQDAGFQRQPGETRTRSSILHTAFDADTEEGTPPITLLPAGKYKAQIAHAIVGPTKNGRGVAVNLTWTISEGAFEKRLVFQNILIEHDNDDARRIGRQKFKDVCSSCGVTGQVTDLDVLLYKDCLISVVIRVDKGGQYSDKNEIRNILPVSTWNAAPPKDATRTTQSLKEASSTPKGFEATDESMDDSIPF